MRTVEWVGTDGNVYGSPQYVNPTNYASGDGSTFGVTTGYWMTPTLGSFFNMYGFSLLVTSFQAPNVPPINVQAANNGQQIATVARPTWKGKNNTCLANFNGTFLGKFDNFFSPLSMIPGIGPDWKGSIAEDVGGGAAKYTIFKFFQAAGNNWGGTSLGAIGKGVSGAIEGVAEGVGVPLMVGATLDQVSAHIACAIVSF